VSTGTQGDQEGLAERFNATAPGYDHLEFTRRAALRLAELADLQPGERVLDVASGTGWGAIEAETGQSAMGTVLRRLPEDRLASFREEHLAEVAPLFTPDGLWTNIPVNFARARRGG